MPVTLKLTATLQLKAVPMELDLMVAILSYLDKLFGGEECKANRYS